jgi:hypothetical protein
VLAGMIPAECLQGTTKEYINYRINVYHTMLDMRYPTKPNTAIFSHTKLSASHLPPCPSTSPSHAY